MTVIDSPHVNCDRVFAVMNPPARDGYWADKVIRVSATTPERDRYWLPSTR
ncbi:MAG: hypothetical protein KIS91_11740 [Anaerolineae bacterium]|nr:hypothetical protein [Anaerolineae bacterium]